MQVTIRAAFASLFFILPVLYAAPVKAIEPDAPEALISRLDAARILILTKLEGKAGKGAVSVSKDERAALISYYSKADSLLWVDEDGLTARVKRAAAAFERAGEWGLDPKDFKLTRSNGEFSSYKGYPAQWLADAELDTTLAVYAYAKQAQTGRVDPNSFGEPVDYHPVPPDMGEMLKGLKETRLSTDAFLEKYNPTHPQFLALKKKLAEARGGSSPRRAAPSRNGDAIPNGPVLKPGVRHPQIAMIRRRLDVPAPVDDFGERRADYYDEDLADAVRDFQSQNGLRGNAVIDSATRSALNSGRDRDESSREESSGSGGADTKLLLVNMERWRWMPRDLGNYYVWVSLPEFMFRVMKNGQKIHEERIVIGKLEHKTPMFAAKIETVVLNPTWNVPGSIAVKEILPMLRRNPDYLERNNLQVFYEGHRRPLDPYSVDWDYVNPNKLTIRQPPGDDNVLGQVKFSFPNKHSVYMHDTTTKNLFNQTVRAYSHGCMRVRNPLRYAEVLLEPQGWNMARIERTLASGEETSIALEHKVPIYITYFTAWVEPDGSLKTYRDIYNHDTTLWASLQGHPLPVASTDVADDVPEEAYRRPRRQQQKPTFFPFDFFN